MPCVVPLIHTPGTHLQARAVAQLSHSQSKLDVMTSKYVKAEKTLTDALSQARARTYDSVTAKAGVQASCFLLVGGRCGSRVRWHQGWSLLMLLSQRPVHAVAACVNSTAGLTRPQLLLNVDLVVS